MNNKKKGAGKLMWRNRRARRKGNLSVILFNKTVIWTAMGSNPDFFGEKLLSSLSHEV